MVKIANDIYEIAVQAVVDKSSQSKIQSSLNAVAQNTTLTIRDVKFDESSLVASARKAVGMATKEFVLKGSVETSSIYETIKSVQDYIRNAPVNFRNASISIDQAALVEQVRQSVEAARYELARIDMSGASDSLTTSFADKLRSAIDQVATEESEALAEKLSHAVDAGISGKEPPPIKVEVQTEGQPELAQLEGELQDVNDIVEDNTELTEDNTEAQNANSQSVTGMIGRLASYAFSMQHVIRYLREMVNITIELNDAMTQLKIVTKATDEEYASYASNIAQTATAIGIATKDLIDASTVYARLGYSLEASSTLAKYTGMLQNVGDVGASAAQESITSILKAFSDEVDIDQIESVMDRLVKIGNNFPISVSQIAEGMKNASSALHAAGNNFNQSVALLTAANTTVQDISKASTGMRTIAARLRNTKAELDELGEEVLTEAKYQELVDMLTEQNVQLVDQEGVLRSTYDVLKDLAGVWEDIGVNERAALATQIAGVRQQNIFYSVIEQFKEAEEAMESMSNSAGTLDTAYATYMESITAHINQFKTAFQALSQTVMDSGIITGIIDIGTALVKLVDGLVKAAKELKIFIPLLTAIPLAAILTHLEGIGKFLGGTALVKGIANLKNLINVIRGVEGAATALGGVAGGLSGFLTAISIIAGVVAGVKAIRDRLDVTLKEHADEIKNTQSEISSLEEQLEGIRDKIAEIKALGTLSITDAEELSKLQGENAKLEAQLKVQKELLKVQEESARIRALQDSRQYGASGSASQAIEQYQSANARMRELQNTRSSVDIGGVAPGVVADIERLQRYRDEWESYTQRQRDNTGYKSLEALEKALAAAKSASKYLENSARDSLLSKAGEDVIEATENMVSQIENIQQLIDFLDPERDAARIHELRIQLVELYNTIGADDAIASSLGTLFSKETNAAISNIVASLKEGEDVGQNITDLWQSGAVQSVVDELGSLGVNIDLGVFTRYIASLGKTEKATSELAETNEKLKKSYIEVISSIQQLAPGLKQLSTVYEDVANGGTFDFSTILGDDFTSTFGKLGDAYTGFIEVISQTPDNLDACQDAFDRLTDAYIKHSGILDDITEETRDVAIAQLEQMGVSNAQAVVISALGDNTEVMADQTWRSVEALYEEAQAGSADAEMLAYLAFKKAAVNSNTIYTSADVDNIITLANAAYAGTKALEILADAKAKFALAERIASGEIASSNPQKFAEYAIEAGRSLVRSAQSVGASNYYTRANFIGPGGGASGGGGGSSSGSSAKEVEEYIANLDKYYAALKRLESAKLAMADANRRLEATEDLNEKIRTTKEIIDLYQIQADAEAELVSLRKQTIATESEGLRALGFQIDYNNKTNEFYVANLEHINELTAETVGEYDSLEEATNALRQETEDLINSLDSLNQENQESVENLHELSQSAKEARQSIVDFYDAIIKEANAVVDGFENVYKVLTNAAKEYASTGFLSVDSLQSILDLGPKYLAMLVDENGQLIVNEKNLQAVIAAKTQDMAAETALSYAKQVLLATERGEEDVLRNLTDATAASSAATWDLAYATVGLAKALGVANGMSEEYYDNAVDYLTKMQSLTETAVNSIPQYYEQLSASYISQADALDTILKLTEDMLKWENQQQIDALNKQKDAYADIIDQKKELIKLTKEEQDHERDLAEKISEIAKLQSRIDQLSLDDSREAQAQKRKLEEELVKLQKNLTDDQADYSLEVQEDALDKQLEMYNDEKDNEIAALEDSLNSAEKLYRAALNELESDYGGTIARLKEWNYEVGNTLQDSLLDAIDAATAALDRFGGSFSAALEGVKDYTNLGTSNTSGAATAASATDIISTMRRNSITWWTTPNQSIEELNAQQASLAKQYSQISGDQIYKDANGTWHHASGDILYSLTAAEKDQIAHNIVAKMKANSAAWFSADDATKKALSEETLELGKRFGWLTGKTPTRDANGTWWLDGKKLYDIYHAGGIVGGGSFKQNEIMALLEKGEAVLDAQKEQAVYKAVDFISALSDRIGSSINASDISRIFGSVSPAAAGGNYASLIRNGAAMAGGLLGGCNIERIDVVAPIQVVQKLDREEIQAHAEMIGAVSAQYIKDGFTKRGIQVGASWF